MSTPSSPPESADKLSPRAFDEYASAYDQAINQGLRFTGEAKEYFAETRLKWTREVLGEYWQPGWNCLDYGCGIGAATPFLHYIVEAGKVWGVDTSAESCELAQQAHGSDRAGFGHPENLADQAGTFDFAYCNGVFHHIPPAERATCAQQIATSLKPGGWFAYWENNPWNPITRLLMALVPFDRDAIMLWPDESRRMIETTGLQVIRTDFLFIFPASLSFLRPLERHVCKLPTGAQYLVLARKPL